MKGKGGAKGSNSTSSVPAPAGAALVEAQPTGSDEPLHFVAMVSSPKTLLERMRDFVMQKQEPVKLEPLSHETLLVSSPGFGVLDSGCGKSIIGMKTFEQFSLIWRKLGVEVPTSFPEINHFRYGNGHHEVSTQSVRLPVYIAGRKGTIKAALVQGTAPLLISRPALRAIQARIDFENDEMTAFSEQLKIPLQTNEAGQYILNIMRTQAHPIQPEVEVMISAQVLSQDTSAPFLLKPK